MEVKNKEYEAELKHFGILGMKWGKRKRSTIADRMSKRKAKEKEKVDFQKEYRQMQRDTILHPVHSLASQTKLLVTKPLKALNLDMESAKKLNLEVANKVANDKSRKENKKKIKDDYHKELEDSYNRFNDGLRKLSDAGRGNDIPAVTGVAKQWDKERAIARAKYKQRKAGI